ncbi:glycosyltransferase family 1 protein [Flavobacterium ranwuense]|uniref:Glycosyltransferase family 1 protein n=1 Tax=Flavobacterium ranwuense TaxID=2541725 RepID=A0ABY2DQ96_9FLAO|nr:glycosyltransferase family 1 protein [Flavobacterium ranwuense]TDE28054.1 glycosyltransferase family 1 protein [Flavobacterium ranwuense]
MNVLFDATWIGTHLKQNAMHGGLRVIYELIKGLENSSEVDLFYSSNKHDLAIINNLISFIEENNYSNSLNKIANNQNEIFKLIHSLNAKIDSYLVRNWDIHCSLSLNHFDKHKLKMMDIYHSPIEAIPNEIKKYKNIKRVFTSHDIMPFVRPDLAPKSFAEILKPAYDSIDRETNIICVSEFTKSELLNYRKDLNENQIEVVYLGANKNVFFPNLSKLDFLLISQKYDFKFEKYLLCLNRNQKYKNTEHIIEAYIKVVNYNKTSDLGLVLIGTFENIEAKKIFIDKYSVYKNIHFIEYVPDVELSVFYSNALSFVYMSLYEGFGLPIIEAMQCGTPVISSNQASLPEVVQNYGICIDPFDVELLSDQMYTVMNDSELSKKLAVKSLERATFFSWEKNLEETVQVYKKIINN